jgi:alpha-glucosidase
MTDEPLPWWRTGVLYQIYPRSFCDTNGDGVGDLDGITERLDHVVELGADAIWLSPIQRSPQVDFGYDVSDHQDVDPRFGDLAAFDRLLAAAHARGLRVLLDYVINHTSDQHPWFLASRSSRTDPKRGWYVWRDPAPDGGPPNNWQSVFGGPAWTLDATTGQYYLHSFHPAQPDLDWRQPGVETAMLGVLRFWLDRGVDGFRVDAPEYVGKDPALPDLPRRAKHEPHRRGVLRPYDALDHLHDKDHPFVHTVLRRVRAVVDAYPGCTTVGEVRISDRRRWAAYFGEGPPSCPEPTNGLRLVFDFAPLKALGAGGVAHEGAPTPASFTAAALRRAVEATQAVLPPGAWPALALGNHDEPRLATRLGDDGARLAAVLLLTLPGTPCIYYGDELGMVDIDVPPHRRADPQGAIDPVMSRDPCRSPMAWTATGGFSNAEVEPWLPLGDNVGERSVERQRHDPGSMLALYRELAALRRRLPALHRGRYQTHEDSDDALYAYWRSHGDQRVLVALNLGSEPRTLPLPAPGRLLLATAARAQAPGEEPRLCGVGAEPRVTLEPRHAALVELTVR